MSRSGRPGGECWPWGLPMSWCARMWAGLARDGLSRRHDTICNSRSGRQLLSSSSLPAGRRVQCNEREQGVFNRSGEGVLVMSADIAVRIEKNRTVMHGDDTSLVWFRGIATPIRFR
eukprot:scaffold78380_cov61-Phaeocystis_antarctica.AAC.3